MFLGLYFIALGIPTCALLILLADQFTAALRRSPRIMRGIDYLFAGLMGAFETMVSFSLQYGVPLELLVKKFAHTRFEQSGYTGNREIPIAKSVLDYIFRWLALKFLPPEALPEEEKSMANGHANGHAKATAAPAAEPAPAPGSRAYAALQEDAPPCSECGSIMVRAGACYRCLNCGSTSGCG